MKPEVQQLQATMRKLGYIAGPSIATAVYLAEKMVKPLLIEGGARFSHNKWGPSSSDCSVTRGST